MNKKVSTLLTVGLMLGGSLLSSSAFAQTGKLVGDIVKEAKNGGTYFLINGENVAVGFSELDPIENTISKKVIAGTSMPDAVADADNYMWEVQVLNKDNTDPSAGKVYKFVNKSTKTQLLFDSQWNIITDYDDATDAIKETSLFAWNGFTAYDGSARVLRPVSNTGLALDAQISNSFSLTSSTQSFYLHEVKNEEVVDDSLNELYNSVGFNFELSKAGVDNIFNMEGVRVRAIQVKSSEGLTFNDNGIYDIAGKYAFPAGTYFVTETPAGVCPTTPQAKIDYLLNSTFIVASSSINKSEDAEEQKAGKGFVLATCQGKDLKTYKLKNSESGYDANLDAQYDNISVHNACFKVTRRTSDGKYAMELNQFRYQAVSGDKTQTIKTAYDIVISPDVYGATHYLCTGGVVADNSYIFSYTESNAVNPITEFLNAEGASIYNIQFVSGKDDDKDELNKYLFAPAYENKMYAKGEVLTDTDMPEFQFVISNVSGNDVTFTNRANNSVQFTAKFFKEGDGYLMAIKDASRDPKNFTVLNVDERGNIDAVTGKTFALNGTVVKLSKPESTDMFNGTWNVEEGTEVTISFARDADPTSNKLYPKYNPATKQLTTVTDDITEGAHWQLVNKSDKPVYSIRPYAYVVGEGDKARVDIKTVGDTTAYYTYNLELVYDGDVVKDNYLSHGSSNELKVVSNGHDFFIKDNVDGSVSIIWKENITYDWAVAFSGRTSDKSFDELLNGNYKGEIETLKNIGETSKANYIKTYLLAEAPEITWTAENGHVTIAGEYGDYITMTDERDAILVNDNENVLYLHAADTKSVLPSFFISQGTGEGSNAESERMYLFNPEDSVNYYVGTGKYDKLYQVKEGVTKAIFKAGKLNAAADTMSTMIKKEMTKVAQKADNKGTEGGLDRFKFQIFETEEGDSFYYIRQKGATENAKYLYQINGKLGFSTRKDAMPFHLETAQAPTSNESVSASEVKVIANNGSINVKNAAGKNVVVSTILGQVVANEVLTSDNATINVPAGIVVVAVEGESFKVNVK